MSEAPNELKFPKPKLLLIDLPEEVEGAVHAAGFNVRAGTFGQPYHVPPSDRFEPMFADARLPNYTEQEVVIIDLTPSETGNRPDSQTPVVDGVTTWFARCDKGEIDPRPMVMVNVRNDFRRIWEAGGVFVVFGRPRHKQQLMWGMMQFGYFKPERKLDFDNWSFLPFFDEGRLVIEFDHGSESTVLSVRRAVDTFLRRHQPTLEFDCAFRPLFPLTKDSDGPIFVPLMENKYGAPIAGVIVPRTPENGWVFILPQFKDKAAAVLELLRTVLPELHPKLFPFAEGGQWVRREEYEHSGVLEKRARQVEIQTKAAIEIGRLEQEIENERLALAYLHGLLAHTGDDLVKDVKTALEAAGFKQVVLVDEAEADSPTKQEDLQVQDRCPILLVEVKGLAGQPTESDTLQVTKYVGRRMKQWDRRDVQGLSLVNHQRHLPALDRDHENVFLDAQVQDAEHYGAGLMTTWDLFRLLRGKARWNWPDEAVCGVLYHTGRVPPYPTHYTRVGRVWKFWPEIGVISIDIENGPPLKVGGRVGFLLPVEFYEEEVVSLHLDHQPIQETAVRLRVGHKTNLRKKDVPVGTQVFKVGN
jgi:hypothetical protein